MTRGANGIQLTLSWQGTSTGTVQETDNLTEPVSWRAFTGRVAQSNGTFTATVQLAPGTGQKYYRVQQ